MRSRVRGGAIALAAVLGVLFGAAPAARAATPACPAAVTAPSAIVIEVSTGSIACARAPEARRPIASTTKLMTALLTLERAKLTDTFRTSSYRPAAGESVIGLLPGERMKVRDLLRGLLVYSGNDAAMALASGVGGSERGFVRLMNKRAKQLGLTETHYENPIGLDAPGNYSSAHDLVQLALVLRTNPVFREIVDLPQVTLKSGDHPRFFRNRNDLVRDYPWVNGVKTGHTRAAGYVLVGSAREHGVQVVSAVLGTAGVGDRDAQSIALLRTGLQAFQNITAVKAGAHVPGVAHVPIKYRPGAGLALVAGRTVHTVISRGKRGQVVLQPLKVPTQVEGPVARGQRLGSFLVVRAGKRIATVPLVAAEAVPAASFGQRTKAWFTRPLAVLLAFAVLGGTVLLARRRNTRSGGGESRKEATAA
jgi:serine-type D-Ala-D-Ala carboxypeptidase (penicillin-binding protein 5/6)